MKGSAGMNRCWCWLSILLLLSAAVKASGNLQSSVFSDEQLKVRYNLAYQGFGDDFDNPSTGSTPDLEGSEAPAELKLKSPGKAFLMSLAVPGLGQYYYGNRWKPFIFLGAEIASWALYLNYHGEGDDLTDDYEAFNLEHWSEDDYTQYLQWTYGVDDDEDLPDWATEATHHLPDTRVQQYYEMTGKYNQFGWGWDDARLDGRALENFDATNTPPRIVDAASTPYSSNRLAYEQMRDDANTKYDQATRMVAVSLINRVFSAFEAYFVTKSQNNKIRSTNMSFSSIKLNAKLKSYHTKRDTPFITFTYQF